MKEYQAQIESLEKEIAELEQKMENAETETEYYKAEFYLKQKILELQMLQEKVNESP